MSPLPEASEGRVARIGTAAIERSLKVIHTVAVVWAVLRASFRRSTWPRTVRDVLARQILFTGFEAIRFVSLLAFVTGLSVVVQTQFWLKEVGQSQLLGPVLVMVIIREVGPLLVNFVVIGRSGTAVATELGYMNISGEVRALDAQGLDPFTYLVVPRVAGMAISIFCLTVIFCLASFVSGYLSGLLVGANPGSPYLFVKSVFGALRPADVANLVFKTVVPGAMTGAICCAEGLGCSTAVTEVPQATTRALVRSGAALFVVSALVSLLTYL